MHSIVSTAFAIAMCFSCVCTYIHKYIIHACIHTYAYTHIGVGAGPAGQVLAGPLLFKVKIKFHFCKKQVMNRNASVIFRRVRLIILLYNR